MEVELVNLEIGKSLQSSFNVRMDRIKWKCNKKTIEVKENSKRKMKDPNKFTSKTFKTE